MGLFEKFFNKRYETENTDSTIENQWAELEQMPSFSEMQAEKEISNQPDNDEVVQEDPEFQKMLESMSSPEGKVEALTFENMSKLTTEQYIKLWQNLNPFYVSHITRQGVRDHVGMIYHSAGLGDIHDGFKGILKDEKILRNPAEVRFGIGTDFTKSDVEKLIDKTVSQEQLDGWNVDDIVEKLPVNSSMGIADTWSDKQAIHFAQHTVLDEYYGGETGNEVFFIYPTDVIASQCKFGGHMHNNLTTAQVNTERKWNDLFAWSKDGNIPIDAGLVFLPENTMVDRKTGSRYASDEDGKIVVDEDRVRRFTDWAKSLTKDSAELVDIDNRNYHTLEVKLKEIGIPEEKIGDMVNYGNYYSFLSFVETGDFGNVWLPEEVRSKMSPSEISDYSCRAFLEDKNAHMKFAEDAISSKEYWESYFTENPDQKPAHVVYYSGEPSEAVRKFLKNNQILEERLVSGDNDYKQVLTGPGDTVERDGDFLGFDKNYIGDGVDDIEMKSEHERFNELAREVIRERQAHAQ